jgi:hypothetical protein
MEFKMEQTTNCHQYFEDIINGLTMTIPNIKRLYNQNRITSEMSIAEIIFDYFIYILRESKIDETFMIHRKDDICLQLSGIIISKKEKEKHDQFLINQNHFFDNDIDNTNNDIDNGIDNGIDNNDTKVKHTPKSTHNNTPKQTSESQENTDTDVKNILTKITKISVLSKLVDVKLRQKGFSKTILRKVRSFLLKGDKIKLKSSEKEQIEKLGVTELSSNSKKLLNLFVSFEKERNIINLSEDLEMNCNIAFTSDIKKNIEKMIDFLDKMYPIAYELLLSQNMINEKKEKLENIIKKVVEEKEIPTAEEKEVSVVDEKVVSVVDEKEVPTADEKEVPTVDEKEVSTVDEKEVPTADEKEVPTVDEKEVPTADEKEVPTVDEKEVSTVDEKEVPTADEKEVPTADEKEVPTADEKEISVVEEKEVSVVDKKEISVVEENEVSVVDKKEIPTADKKEIPTADKKVVSVVKEKEIPTADEKEVPTADEKEISVVDNKEISVVEEKEVSVVDKKEIPTADKKVVSVVKEKEIPTADEKEVVQVVDEITTSKDCKISNSTAYSINHNIDVIRKKVELKDKNLAFMIFCEYVKQQTPHVPSLEFKKICSVMWKGKENVVLNDKMKSYLLKNNITMISENDKLVYITLAAEAKVLKLKDEEEYEKKLVNMISEKLKKSQIRKILKYVFNGKDIKCDMLNDIVKKYNIIKKN